MWYWKLIINHNLILIPNIYQHPYNSHEFKKYSDHIYWASSGMNWIQYADHFGRPFHKFILKIYWFRKNNFQPPNTNNNP